jgi:hypothetical protein
MGRRLPAILYTEPCQGFDSLTFWASAPVLCPLLFCEERLGQLWSSRTRVFKKVICCSISVTGRSIARSLKDIKRLLHSLQGPRILASCCARAASATPRSCRQLQLEQERRMGPMRTPMRRIRSACCARREAPTWPDLSPIPESALQTFCASPGRPSGRSRAGFPECLIPRLATFREAA